MSDSDDKPLSRAIRDEFSPHTPHLSQSNRYIFEAAGGCKFSTIDPMKVQFANKTKRKIKMNEFRHESAAKKYSLELDEAEVISQRNPRRIIK